MRVVQDRVVRILWKCRLTKMSLTLGHPEHHDRMPERSVGRVELKVRKRVLTQAFVSGCDVRALEQMRQAGETRVMSKILEELMHVDHPSDVEFPWTDARHFPVENGNRDTAPTHNVSSPRATPIEDRRPLFPWPMPLEPFEGVLNEWRPGAVPR